MTTVYFIRHGQSEANRDGWLAGHSEAPLTELGLRQAELTAELLRDVPLTHIYTSDLLRAVQTAAPHAERHGLPMERTEELREFDAGAWTGRRYDELADEYPHLYPERWQSGFGEFCAPGGEAVSAAAERLERFVRRVAVCHAGGVLLLSTHAGILRAFFGRLYGIAPAELSARLPFCENASHSCAVVEHGRIRPLWYGRTDI